MFIISYGFCLLYFCSDCILQALYYYEYTYIHRMYATIWKVAGSIPDEVIRFFFFLVDLILLAALWTWDRLSL
jgi:hypothetical protein